MDQAAHFGTWLKQQRKSRRMTQEGLAERLACSVVLVQKIEAGDRTPSAQLASLIGDWASVPPTDRDLFLQFARGRLNVREAEGNFSYAIPDHSSSRVNRSNIPVSLTSIIGRAEEIQALEELLLDSETRLLTLTGPPGIGKTRLALQVLPNMRGNFRDGVYFVGLAALSDPDLVAVTIAQALGIANEHTGALLGTLRDWLGKKQMLLALDNFEQVLDAAPLVMELLSTCLELKVLITSREALHIQGEQQFPVPALSFADPTKIRSIHTLGILPAIALFLERAQSVQPEFSLTEQNAGAVATICARLDGLPLAIELAAARIRLLSPREMQTRLDSRLPLLTGGPRSLPARQRTLRIAIDWSYNLLSQKEQTLFARLGVFVGGCDLLAATTICKAEDDPAYDIQEGIESLLDKNLLKREEHVPGESRFIMLELIREYSIERLQANAEEEEIRRLHAEYYLALAEEASAKLRSSGHELWLIKLELEHDNIRSALRWLLNTEHAILAMRLSEAMRTFWHFRGHFEEGLQWLQAALLAGSNAPPLLRGDVLSSMGDLAQKEGDFKQAILWSEESLDLYRKAGDINGISKALHMLAFSLLRQGELERATELCKEGLALTVGAEYKDQAIGLLYTIASAVWYRGDFALAKEFMQKGLELNRGQEKNQISAVGLNMLGLIAHYQGDHKTAEAFYEQSLAIAMQIGLQQEVAFITCNMADLALSQGDHLRASPLVMKGLRLLLELGDKVGFVEQMESRAWLASMEGQQELAVQLFAAVAALREANNLPLPIFARTHYEGIVDSIHSRMNKEAFAKAWQEGSVLTIDQVLDYALRKA